MQNILESYLVRLGFEIDGAGLARFEGALRSTRRSVDSMVGVSGARLLGWQGAATGAFVGMGAALAGLVDKVAMADQNYRLFALRMFTTQAVGRELSITMKALGASLDQIVWDPELHARAMQLFKDQEEIVKNMGVGFEYNMRSLRDLRFEFQRLGVILQYGSFEFVSDIFQKLFPQFGNFIEKFHNWNDWLIQNLPQEANRLAGQVVGVIREVEDIGRHLFEMFDEGGKLLIHTIGIISGDKSLQGAKLNWNSIGKAMSDAFAMLAKFIVGMTTLETQALHLMNALEDFLTGHPIDAVHELNAAKKGAGTKAAQTGAGAVVGGLLGSGLGPVGTAAGATLGGYVGAHAKSWWNTWSRGLWLGTGMGQTGGIPPAAAEHGGAPSNLRVRAALAAAQVSYMTGLPANLIWDQWAFETNGFRHMAGKNNLGGIMSGGKFANYGSLENFASSYAKIAMGEPGIKGAKTVTSWAQAMRAGHYWTDPTTVAQYAGGMARYDKDYRGIAAQVHIDNVNITVPPTTKSDKQVIHYIREAMKFDVQKNLAQAGGGPYQQ
jgi:hypothetical protein